MARPTKRRTAQSYARDIEAINRLRTAILLDRDADPRVSALAVEQIDTLTRTLVGLIPSDPRADTIPAPPAFGGLDKPVKQKRTGT